MERRPLGSNGQDSGMISREPDFSFATTPTEPATTTPPVTPGTPPPTADALSAVSGSESRRLARWCEVPPPGPPRLTRPDSVAGWSGPVPPKITGSHVRFGPLQNILCLIFFTWRRDWTNHNSFLKCPPLLCRLEHKILVTSQRGPLSVLRSVKSLSVLCPQTTYHCLSSNKNMT